MMEDAERGELLIALLSGLLLPVVAFLSYEYAVSVVRTRSGLFMRMPAPYRSTEFLFGLYDGLSILVAAAVIVTCIFTTVTAWFWILAQLAPSSR